MKKNKKEDEIEDDDEDNLEKELESDSIKDQEDANQTLFTNIPLEKIIPTLSKREDISLEQEINEIQLDNQQNQGNESEQHPIYDLKKSTEETGYHSIAGLSYQGTSNEYESGSGNYDADNGFKNPNDPNDQNQSQFYTEKERELKKDRDERRTW